MDEKLAKLGLMKIGFAIVAIIFCGLAYVSLKSWDNVELMCVFIGMCIASLVPYKYADIKIKLINRKNRMEKKQQELNN